MRGSANAIVSNALNNSPSRLTIDRHLNMFGEFQVAMKYKSGIEVQQGDVVLIRRSQSRMEGVVLKIIQPNTEESNHWSLADGGVLIEGGGFGLSATKSLAEDEDIVFVRRAQHVDT